MTKGSKKFIDWAMKDLTQDNGWGYHEYFRKFISKVRYYEQHPEIFLPLMKNKFTIAAEEYGDPLLSTKEYDIDKEVEMEILDGVAGWPIVGKYKKLHKKSK